MRPVGLGPENDCAGEDQQHKDYKSKYSVEKTVGHYSQGACRQDELIGGKPPVVK
jgi:hypothetical protein